MISAMKKDFLAMNRVYGARTAILQRGLLALVLVLGFAVPALSAPVLPARTVLVLGDSLSAGYGLARGQGWVDLTSERLAKERPAWKTVNASISGETSAGGAARVAAELARHRPAVVVVELGANDGLRGLPTTQQRANLERIVRRAQASGARVLLVGMRMPPNLGRRYTRDFEAAFADTAKKYRTGFVPFLLAPIAADRAAFQIDNLHPVAAAQPQLRDHVWTQLRPLLSAPRPAPAARASGG
jgi:acyl-CoA thioesterase-1